MDIDEVKVPSAGPAPSGPGPVPAPLSLDTATQMDTADTKSTGFASGARDRAGSQGGTDTKRPVSSLSPTAAGDVKKHTLDLSNIKCDEPILLRAKDGSTYSIARGHTLMSNLIATGLEKDPRAEEIPLDVDRVSLQCILRYMDQHKGVEAPVPQYPLLHKDINMITKDPYDAELWTHIQGHRQRTYDLVTAANYLGMNSLVHLICAGLATLLKGKPLKESDPIIDPELHKVMPTDQAVLDKFFNYPEVNKSQTAASSASAPAAANSSTVSMNITSN